MPASTTPLGYIMQQLSTKFPKIGKAVLKLGLKHEIITVTLYIKKCEDWVNKGVKGKK